MPVIIGTALMWLLLNFFFEAETNTVLYSSETCSTVLTTLVILIFVFNSYLCTKFKFDIPTIDQVRF